jgi:hypothetical protein
MLFAVMLSIILLVFLVFWLLLWKLPQWQVAAVPEMKDRIDLESKSRQTLAQILGGAALLVGLYFTSQTLQTTQEGQITDRFTKAITQLGDHNLAVRLGGIYALERIAKDSASDHWSVMEVLTAFVREYSHGRSHSPWEWVSMLFTKDRWPEDRAESKPPADIQAVLTVIGRRTRTYENGETRTLNLRDSNLQGAVLWEAQLQHAYLRDAQLQGAVLGKAQLQGAVLWGAQLQHADLWGAQLQGAYLRDAQLQGAILEKAQLQGAVLWGAQLQGADLRDAQLQGVVLWDAQLQDAVLAGAGLQGVNLTEVENLTQDQIDMTCMDEHTKLPKGLTRPAPCLTNP